MKFQNVIIIFIFIIVNYFGSTISLTSLNKFKYEKDKVFGNINNGCEAYVGVVLQDSSDIKSFSSNVLYNYLQVEKDDLKVYYLIINKIQFGNNSNIQFSVLNELNENSTIVLNQAFHCKELKSPINYSYINKVGYIEDDFVYYDINLGYGLKELASSFSCSSNFGFCSIGTKIDPVFVIKVKIDINSYVNQKEFKISLLDSWNTATEIIVDTPKLFQREIDSSTIINNLYLNYPNNSLIYRYNDYYVTMLLELRDYNSLVYSSFNNFNYYSKLAYGTNEKKTLLFSFPTIYPSINITTFDAAKTVKRIATFNFNAKGSSITQSGQYKTSNSQMVGYGNFNLVYKLNQIQLSDLIQGFSVRIYSTNDIPLPYGFKSLGSQWLFGGEYLAPPILKSNAFSIVLNGTSKTIAIKPETTFPNIILKDSKAPSLHSISFKLLENNKVLIKMHITDQGSGVYLISSKCPDFQVVAFNYLISGTLNDGIFEIVTDLKYSGNLVEIELVDYFGTSSGYIYYINENLDMVGYFIPNLGNASITLFSFSRLEIDTSFDDLDLQLLVKFSLQDNSIIPSPYVEIKNQYSNTKVFFGRYIKERDLFQIDIKVPARESGYFQYTFNSVVFDLPISSSSLEFLFPSQKVLLTTNYIDHFPPMIQEITILDQVINNDDDDDGSGSVMVGWNLLIKDFPVGLSYGTIEISSDKDINPIILNIKPDESVPSSDTLANYKLQFKVKSNIKQTFIISKCKLVDKNGYTSQYPQNEQVLIVLNPFMYVGNDPKAYSFTVIPSSNNTIQDSLAPILLSLDFPSTLNSFLPNRLITFTFSTIDQGDSGISKDHNPWVYIQSYQSFIRVQGDLIKVENSIHYYNATIEIPYGFLYTGAIVSIHGITDNNLNVALYFSDDLLEMGFKSSISNSLPFNPTEYPPVILEFSSITQNGGTLYLYGKNFGTSTSQIKVYCDLNDGNGFTNQLLVSSIENVALSVIVPKIIKSSSTPIPPKVIKIKIVKFVVNAQSSSSSSSQLTESNIISILPIQVLPEVILNCNGYSNCNDRGICINGECQCYKGYYGLDCSSNKTLETGKPDSDKPTFSFYGSLIEIKQILESDINGGLVKEFNLTNWNYKLENPSSIYPNSTSYIYTSNLNNSLKTRVQVVISVFNQKSNINYANQVLHMEKDSIKYTISMEQYDFKTQFNTLKLIIKTSISDTNQKCSFYDYALNSNGEIDWIKLRINGNTTIMGKFISSGIVDYRIIKVSNQLVVAPTLENQEAIIGVSCPFFRNSILLDPDFQVLVDHSNLQNNKSSCYLNIEIQNDNNGLNTAQLVSVITVSVFIALTLTITISIILKKNVYRVGCKLYYIGNKTKDSNLELDNK